MICTEAEAKTKWCPMARAIVDGAGDAVASRNGHGAGLAGTECLGSACMLWGWLNPPPRHDGDKPQRGRCGLARNAGEYPPAS